MSPATLLRPASLAEACTLLAEGDQAMPYGGGTAVQILLKQGVLFASALVDLARVPGLDEISRTDEGLRVGAMVTLRRMETDPLVRAVAPLAARVYGRVANPRVRNTASVGGNLAHGDYRLDPPTALLVLDARLELHGVDGVRRVPIREFFTGLQRTALHPGELVAAVEIPAQPSPAAAFVKLSSQSAHDWPCASVAALVAASPGRRRELRLGLGALAGTPVYLAEELSAGADTEEVVRAARSAADTVINPIPDIRGGAVFKRRLGLVAVEDAVRAAWVAAVELGTALDDMPGRPAADPAGEEQTDARRQAHRRWWRRGR
ncbi:MAG TPA: FAD binding domain-containing protein [Pseudonocardia sp.]|nr:FAD binding domain-containing protein [Pseudonocardia sp.]